MLLKITKFDFVIVGPNSLNKIIEPLVWLQIYFFKIEL